jgi:hypothetical protein
MPQGTSAATTTTRRRRTARTDAGSILGQVNQLVATNETLKRENAELLALNEQLRAHLAEIGSTPGRLTGGPRRRGRRGAEPFAVVAEAKPKRTRKPITDPEQLERRRAALAKARGAGGEVGGGEGGDCGRLAQLQAGDRGPQRCESVDTEIVPSVLAL